MARRFDGKLILEDGSEYYGYRFGATAERVVEVVFHTAMVGYQEIISDPAYTNQGVVLTYPLVGGYGIHDQDSESHSPGIGALIVGELCTDPSNFRCQLSLEEELEHRGIPGLEILDTRRLARSIRDHGCCLGLLTDADTDVEVALERIRTYTLPADAVARVSTKKIRFAPAIGKTACRVAAIDCGIRSSVIRALNRRGCDVTVFPYDTPAEEIERMDPDGLYISGGPGDPMDAAPVIRLVRELRGKLPILGVGLGHQIVALAYGAKTYKLKFGHRGSNHPVKDLTTGKVQITSQAHGYAVLPESLEGTGLEVTHIDLMDGAVEGLRCEADRVFTAQYQPEGTLDPEDSGNRFDLFVREMKNTMHQA